MTLAERFGLNLAALRREAGITQEELAAQAFTSRVVLSRLENGHALPRLNHVVCLAKALGVQVRDLLYGIE
jgi:transcriptional regulator with XRE-family HTH domain